LVIIRRQDEALLFISQSDHARLSADLLAHWTADGFATHPRRDALLLAAGEHDNGWREVDEAPVFSSAAGMALDFMTVTDEVKQSVWPRGLDRLAPRSAYAAALVAQHAISVYERQREKPSWAAFFDDMAARRDRELARTSHSARELADDYRFIGVADLLSLSFCNAWADTHERFGCAVRYAGGAIHVTPPLFSEPVSLRIRVRRLPDRRYASAADLRAAFDDTAPEILEGRAHGDPAS
jgi:hypothetical protein